MENLQFTATTFKGGFWKYYADLVKNTTVYAVYDRFAETGRFAALRCDWKEGEPNRPHIFWDSDIAKWMEGAAYLMEREPEGAFVPELTRIIDECADLIEKNQREDGYFNSYYCALEPENIFKTRDCHELYCTGHFIEAAIAYHKATGKDKLLNCMKRNVNCIYRVFVEEETAEFTTPGHEEIEIALLRLYRYTGDEKALRLARFFLDKRGTGAKGDLTDDYRQDNAPLRELTEAVGHSVRAGYLYTAMAMLAREDGDKAMWDACLRILDNIVTKRMSITGGVGATQQGERFTYDYDLPNDIVYNETCAAIALAMFAGELQQAEVDSRYGDLIERIYYNGFISGLSLSGDHFYYTNPLEIDLKKRDHEGIWYPAVERVRVFSCSCCPPNVVRMLGSLGRYMYTVDGDTLYCNQFADCETTLTVGGGEARLIQTTDYPASGRIHFRYEGAPVKLCVRIPAWCEEYKGATVNGFAEFNLTDGDEVTVDLPMHVHFMEANPFVQDCAGRYAVMRGPLVYCLEGVDNGENLRDVTILEGGKIEVTTEDWLPAPVITVEAERRTPSTALYARKHNSQVPFTAKLIPYFAFANRGASDMLVWAMVK